MVTGGEDRNVNMWRVGKPNNILCLSGHQSPVECVVFDNKEEKVFAGSQGGSLKCYDLQEGKVFRTLSGHMSNCCAVDSHPFGQFIASGSLDTNLKVFFLCGETVMIYPRYGIRDRKCVFKRTRGIVKKFRLLSLAPMVGGWLLVERTAR